MTLEDAMTGYGRQIDADRPASIADMINILGGTGHVAELMGVTVRTVERWRASETQSAKQQRPRGAERARPELEKLAVDKQMDELREKMLRDGLVADFDGQAQISQWNGNRSIRSEMDDDSVEDFAEKLDAWLDALQGHHWTDAANRFNQMFWEAYLPGGIADRAAIVSVDELSLDAFAPSD